MKTHNILLIDRRGKITTSSAITLAAEKPFQPIFSFTTLGFTWSQCYKLFTTVIYRFSNKIDYLSLAGIFRVF
jgi:hypothetical protein